MNASRKALYRRLAASGYTIECGSGGRTKFNRTKQGYPKAHWIDAACVGVSGEHVRLDPAMVPLLIKAMGRSSRQFRRNDAYGFPLRRRDGEVITPRQRARVTMGFQTGDIVCGVKRDGKYRGTHIGRVTMQTSGSCQVKSGHQAVLASTHKIVSFHVRNLKRLQHADGYSYKRHAKPSLA